MYSEHDITDLRDKSKKNNSLKLDGHKYDKTMFLQNLRFILRLIRRVQYFTHVLC